MQSIWEGPVAEIKDEDLPDFIKAGKRNLAKVLPPVMPGEEQVAALPT